MLSQAPFDLFLAGAGWRALVIRESMDRELPPYQFPDDRQYGNTCILVFGFCKRLPTIRERAFHLEYGTRSPGPGC